MPTQSGILTSPLHFPASCRSFFENLVSQDGVYPVLDALLFFAKTGILFDMNSAFLLLAVHNSKLYSIHT